MYQLSIDNGEVGHVWKQNVAAENENAASGGYESMSE
jgi:hypothetical protein